MRSYYWFFGLLLLLHSDSGIFFTFAKVIFFTLQFPRSADSVMFGDSSLLRAQNDSVSNH